ERLAPAVSLKSLVVVEQALPESRDLLRAFALGVYDPLVALGREPGVTGGSGLRGEPVGRLVSRKRTDVLASGGRGRRFGRQVFDRRRRGQPELVELSLVVEVDQWADILREADDDVADAHACVRTAGEVLCVLL